MDDTLVWGRILEWLIFLLDSLLHDQRRSSWNFMMVLVLAHSHIELTFIGAHVRVQMLRDSLSRASCGHHLPRSWPFLDGWQMLGDSLLQGSPSHASALSASWPTVLRWYGSTTREIVVSHSSGWAHCCGSLTREGTLASRAARTVELGSRSRGERGVLSQAVVAQRHPLGKSLTGSCWQH